jgi:hypothetical protein
MRYLTFLLFLVSASTSFSDEISDDFKLYLENVMSQEYCTDILFLNCLGQDQANCYSQVKMAIRNCEFETLLSEVEDKYNADTGHTLSKNLSNTVGKCVGDNLRINFGVRDTVYNKCMLEHMARSRNKYNKLMPGRE